MAIKDGVVALVRTQIWKSPRMKIFPRVRRLFGSDIMPAVTKTLVGRMRERSTFSLRIPIISFKQRTLWIMCVERYVRLPIATQLWI